MSDSLTPKKRRQGAQLGAQEREVVMETFLRTFSQTANVMLSARAAGIARQTIYYWQEHDTDDFSKRYNIALEDAKEAIEAEIYRRGVTGWDEPVHYKGEVVDTIRKYDHTLLIFLAKGLMPSKYRDRGAVVTAQFGDKEKGVTLAFGPGEDVP